MSFFLLELLSEEVYVDINKCLSGLDKLTTLGMNMFRTRQC